MQAPTKYLLYMENKIFEDILLRFCKAVYKQNTIQKWAKGCILSPFFMKVDLGIIKNYRRINLRAISASIYNGILYNRIDLKK